MAIPAYLIAVMGRFIDRFAAFMLVLLISIDQGVQTVIVGIWWLFTGRGKKPDPDETLSGLFGRHAARGKRWPVLPAAIVDALFLLLTLGRERNHCAVTFEHEKGGVSPPPPCPVCAR